MLPRLYSALIACVFVVLTLHVPRHASAQCLDSEDCYVDLDGKTQRASDAYLTLHKRPKPHYLRAALEETVFVGLGVTWYWLDRQNQADWDFPGFGARFTGEVLRFDNNSFPINFLWHPLSGAAYYHAARSNSLGLGASMAYSIATSMAWEYGVEFREKVSINDLITTPVAGIAVGEFWSRFALYVAHPVSAHARGQRAFAYSLGLMQTIHDRIDHTQGRSAGPADKLGYSAALFHRFSTSLGAGVNAGKRIDRQPTANLTLDGTFVAIPSYLRPGSFRRFVHDADVTRLRFTLATTSKAEGELDLSSDAILMGYYVQQISDRGIGGSVLLGTGVGYRYRRVRFDGFDDDVSLTHMPGLSLEADALFARAGLHLSARVGPDFAGIRAWAFPDWRRDHPEERTKTVLERAGYIYAFGGSTALSAELSLPHLRLGGRGLLGRYRSKDGLDRSQEELTDDAPTSDLVLDAEGYARVYPFQNYGLLLELSLLMRRRVSSVDGYEQEGKLRRASLQIGAEF